MAWQSPYRGHRDAWLSPRAREWASRGTMALAGLVMLYFSLRGIVAFYDIWQQASTQPAIRSRFGRPRTGIPGLPLIGLILLGLLGSLTLIAAIVPVSAMQRWFERHNRPPVTGDRPTGSNGLSRWWWP
ncbi:MAG TPA: hypothetical protein VF595_07510 [Tepidisphaeraceae bacterium]